MAGENQIVSNIPLWRQSRSLSRSEKVAQASFTTVRIGVQKFDPEELRATAERYVAWSALVVEAVIANLEKRRWTETKSVVAAMANESLEEAKKSPPGSLKSIFSTKK